MFNINKEMILPEEQLPDCWNDEARVNVLFAPFRNRSVNPKDWDSKLSFWKNLIALYCVHNKVFTFRLSELMKIFNRKGRSPACLSVVVDELFKAGELKSLETFLQKPTETWGAWAADLFIKTPVLWSFNKIKNSVTTPEKDITYVHVYAVEVESKKLVNNIPETVKNKIISLRELADTVSLRMECLKILLHHLLCEGKASIREVGNKEQENVENWTLLKFCDVKKCGHITNTEVDVYTLEQTEKALVKDIDRLEDEASSLIVDAKSYLIKGRKQTAKTCLRKKNEVERRIEKRSNALHNVNILLSRMNDVDYDVKVLDVYKTALCRLRNTFNENGLTEELVSHTMLELDEVLEIHDDVQSALARTNVSNTDDDLEAELAELLEVKDDTTTEEENSSRPINTADTELADELKKLDIKLPSPPSDKTSDSKTKLSL